jgi:hypothetical protein
MSEEWISAVKTIKQLETEMEKFLSARFPEPSDDRLVSKAAQEYLAIMKAKFPTMISRITWHVDQTLLNYILIHISSKGSNESPATPVVWSKDEDVIWELDSLDKFIQIIETEALHLKHNLQVIINIFKFFQRGKRIIKDEDVFHPPFGVVESKRGLLAKYLKKVSPLSYSEPQGQSQVQFWTSDVSSGDLEWWLFTQDEDRLEVQTRIREEGFFETILRK